MDIVRVSCDLGPGVDCLRKGYVEVVSNCVCVAAVDYPVLATSLHHHFPAVGQLLAPLAVDRVTTPLEGRNPSY